MAPLRPPSNAHSTHDEAVTGLKTCSICSKKFKVRGFLSHETSCKRQKEQEKDRLLAAHRYEQSQKAMRRRAAMNITSAIPSPDPSLSFQLDDDPGPGPIPGPSNEPDFGEPISGLLQEEEQAAPSIDRSAHSPAQSQANNSQFTEFKTEFHPRSQQEALHQSYEDFRAQARASRSVVDPTPWIPFRTAADFEFAEVALDASLNKRQVELLLNLIARVSRGDDRVTLKNDAELRKTCDAAGQALTPFSKHEITVPYKREERSYEVHTRPVWEWALDLLQNPLLAPHFKWDAQRLYKRSAAGEFERFYDEPWTGDNWWDIQTSLPHDLNNAVPFGLILYADKSNLSSFGTVKGYPVVVRCANLPVEIRNSQQIGGGTVVGWLPIVEDDPEEEGKLGYTNLKRVVWHEAFFKLLDEIILYSGTGYAYTSPYDKIMCWLFPVILILSADYEEQCMMSLIRGRGGKCPCPVCLVPKEHLHDLSQVFNLRSHDEGEGALQLHAQNRVAGEERLKALGLRPVSNIFWLIHYSCLHRAISFDRLHIYHGGLWGRHIWPEIKKILSFLGHDEQGILEKYVGEFPHRRGLNHFQEVILVSFADGNKLRDLSMVRFLYGGTSLCPMIINSQFQQVFYAALHVLKKDITTEGYSILQVLASYLRLDSLVGLNVQTESTLRAFENELQAFDKALKGYIEVAQKPQAIEGLKVNWDFPKAHLAKHVVRDICNKGAARNYSTRPNEGMHGPLKEAYQLRSNGKDVAGQVLRVDHHRLAMKLIRMRMDHIDEDLGVEEKGLQDGDEADVEAEPVIGPGDCRNVKLGSKCPSATLADMESKEHSNCSFVQFRKKLCEFLNCSLNAYGFNVQSMISLAADSKVGSHFQSLGYESYVDWKLSTDHLHCNPSFFGRPRYDSVLFQDTETETAFARLLFIFTCNIPNVAQTLAFAFVHPYTAKTGATRSIDRDLKLKRVKLVPHLQCTFIPLCSIIHGAILVPDNDHQYEYFVVDHLDGDMYLRMNS
ncbi:hypothetical protein J3R83DRAFT_5109 [Lanmaoa asiatica]|nr:hypothetical protein J3R83DRAFT_5109 [Lanmaoa asiatica]